MNNHEIVNKYMERMKVYGENKGEEFYKDKESFINGIVECILYTDKIVHGIPLPILCKGVRYALTVSSPITFKRGEKTLIETALKNTLERNGIDNLDKVIEEVPSLKNYFN